MCGPLSHYPEIFSCLYKPRTEELVPHTIDGDPCGERILWADGPFRKSEAIVRCVCGQQWKKVRRVGFNSLSARRVHSARQHMSIRDRRLFPRNQRQVTACGYVVQLLIERGHFALDPAPSEINIVEVELGDNMR